MPDKKTASSAPPARGNKQKAIALTGMPRLLRWLLQPSRVTGVLIVVSSVVLTLYVFMSHR